MSTEAKEEPRTQTSWKDWASVKKPQRAFSTILPAVPFVIVMGLLYHKTFLDMVRIWYHDANYSHGFLIPFLSAYFMWERRDRLAQIEFKPKNIGLLLLCMGLTAYLLGAIGGANTTIRVSFFFVTLGLVIFLFGMDLYAVVSFPVLYLVFMVPLPAYLYDSIAFPLKSFISYISVECLNTMHMPAYLEGNIIRLPTLTIEVADACSGVRSIYSILALAVAYAEILKLGMGRRVALVLSVVPVAVICNTFRVVMTGMLVKYYSTLFVEGIMHEFAGIAVFLLMVALLLAIGAISKS